jgi:hypothetical protein
MVELLAIALARHPKLRPVNTKEKLLKAQKKFTN